MSDDDQQERPDEHQWIHAEMYFTIESDQQPNDIIGEAFNDRKFVILELDEVETIGADGAVETGSDESQNRTGESGETGDLLEDGLRLDPRGRGSGGEGGIE